ncbi:MAG: YceI family protein [Chloroflexota bacterium]|nr:YceI family protein [Chloroflexota bacterium]
MFRRPPISRRVRIAIIGVSTLLLAFGAAYAYFAIRTSDAPPPAALGAAPDGASAANFSADEINGRWPVVSADGFVGYRVREILGIVPAPNDAVGRTSAVNGSLEIEDAKMVAAEITADMTKVKSDEHQRDVMLQENGLETNVYGEGSFRLTEPVSLASAKIGRAVHVAAPGRLTLHGVTKQVRFPLDIRWNGDTVQAAGQLSIRRADFNLTMPQQMGLRIAERGTIELELTFARNRPDGAGSAAASQTATTKPPSRKERVADGNAQLVISRASAWIRPSELGRGDAGRRCRPSPRRSRLARDHRRRACGAGYERGLVSRARGLSTSQ